VLHRAEAMAAARFPGFVHGHRPEDGQVDCVQFVAAVLETVLERRLTPEEEERVRIGGRFRHLGRAIRSSDPRTKVHFPAD
jgi:hypothetical protein